MTKTKTTYAPRSQWRGQHVSGQLHRTMTAAGRRLTSWLDKLAPERQVTLGLLEPEKPPHRPHNRARARARKARRHMVQASRRANR